MRRAVRRSLALLGAAALTGCFGGSWAPSDEARAMLSRVSQQDPGLALEWPAGLPGDSNALLDDAARVLDEQAAWLVEVDRRHAQALTEEERSRLAEVRHDGIEHLSQDVLQLRAALGWWSARAPTQELALVLDPVEEKDAARRPPDPRSQPVQLGQVVVLEAGVRPAGVFLRGVSLPFALRALRDAMLEWARAKGALSPEARERFLPAR